MKKYNWAEWIGFVFILIGFTMMLLQDSWEDNSFGGILENNLLFSSIGLLIWALGYMKRQAKEKKEKEQGS